MNIPLSTSTSIHPSVILLINRTEYLLMAKRGELNNDKEKCYSFLARPISLAETRPGRFALKQGGVEG